MRFLLLAFTLIVCNSYFVSAQSNWEKSLQKNGITVYLRDIEGSSFKEFKGEMNVESSISAFVAAIRDMDNFASWTYKCIEATLLKSEGNDRYVYVLNEAPWPVKNRDMVYFSRIIQDTSSLELTITLEGRPNFIPEKEGIVRIPVTDGFWKLKPLGNGKLKVTFQVHAEAGGQVPSWLSNLAVVESPYETLMNIREEVKKPEYRNSKCDFIKELE